MHIALSFASTEVALKIEQAVVALAVMAGQKTLAELAQQFEVHPFWFFIRPWWARKTYMSVTIGVLT